jgi:hypothetical protein
MVSSEPFDRLRAGEKGGKSETGKTTEDRKKLGTRN